MTKEDVVARLVPLMQDVFDDDAIAYSDTLTAADVEEWDSLSHIRLMVSVEKAFGVRFTSAELEGYATLGDLVDALVTKTA